MIANWQLILTSCSGKVPCRSTENDFSRIQVYNDITENVFTCEYPTCGRNAKLYSFLLKFEKMNKDLPKIRRKQTIVTYTAERWQSMLLEFSDALGYAVKMILCWNAVLRISVRSSWDYFPCRHIRKASITI
jgi:hypothetical protein